MQRVVFHIPHDGTAEPGKLMRSVCVSKEVFEFYREKMQDNDVSKLVPDGYKSVCFKICRLLCDVERFADEKETMEKYGMGFCYEKVYDGTVIKQVSEKLKKDTMKYYIKHHRLMDRLARQKQLFIIDLHSFSDDIVVNNDSQPYSDICIGFDDGYCNPYFVQRIADLFHKAGYSVSVNSPYKGSFVPNAAMNDRSIVCFSVMIEINKRVYRSGGITRSSEILRLRKILGQIALEAEILKN